LVLFNQPRKKEQNASVDAQTAAKERKQRRNIFVLTRRQVEQGNLNFVKSSMFDFITLEIMNLRCSC